MELVKSINRDFRWGPYCSRDFEAGDYVRLYLIDDEKLGEYGVREGTVLDPFVMKKSKVREDSALKIKLAMVGTKKFDNPVSLDLVEKRSVKSYFYFGIVKAEKR